MMTAETMTETLNSLYTKSKRTYKHQKDIHSDILTNSVTSSTTNSNDWHRLLLARLKPGVTRKYRTTGKNGTISDIISSTSFEDQNVTLKSYIDESLAITQSRRASVAQSDALKSLDSSIEISMKRDNHYVKNSLSNRSGNTITSLKRRVRKQQMRCTQTQPSFIQETTYQLPSSTNLIFMPYSDQAELSHRYRPKKCSSVVQLPPLINANKAVPTHTRDTQLSIYAY
ncbi:unnamed protein product [Rotaria socialis]|uniref:Uncharacterized protein n=3 Tax=Rotaria socialis TaxID=392032 RepID=A0A817RSB8_9BILA|nr:unnamed protein product [Rotaria socialis]CAF4189118.1 unnamed protein product [Rotaria socialis]CAF4433328.1 unnamed protein product [Rotaria socialis]CAF4539054.1 unnamed protein product [Rotaria socialis]CAF4561171.1 unnamed protein product [Rotaria socialis]